MATTDRIELNPRVMLGKPVIRGTRIPVELVLRKLADGARQKDLLDAYPRLTSEDIKAALAYAADTVAHEQTVIVGKPTATSKKWLRFLADESCDFGVVRALRDAGHDVVAVAEISPRADDKAVADLALRDDRILLTEDKDFGRLAFATTRTAGGVILIRFPGDARRLLGPTVVDAVAQYGGRLAGSFVVVSPGRIRITETPWGLLLSETRRLHPDLCRYVSAAFYESKLLPHASTFGQGVLAGSRLGAGAGLVFLPVEHDHRAARSAEEARLAAEIVEELLRCRWTDEKGREASLTADDILLVAPYNAQVAELSRAVQDRLGFPPRAGTVDKFQGQEAAVVLYSMATSSPEDAPRNLDFLYSRNRLNVAVSRARCFAVVLASPKLLDVPCRTPELMRALNAFCQLLEASRGVVPTSRTTPGPGPL